MNIYSRLAVTTRQARSAGRKRLALGRELAHHLIDTARSGALLDALKAPIAGASQNVIFVTTSPAALGAVQTTFIGPLIGLPQSPLILCMAYIPQITGTTATATVTLQMRRTDTPAVIGNAVHLCGTADTNPGPFIIVGYVPTPANIAAIPAGSGIDVQGAASAGAGTLTASATAPLSLGAFGLA